MKAYKLTDENGQTHGGCQWGEGITNTATQEGIALCTNQVIHVYADPYMAVFANPIHAEFEMETALLWECECSDIVNRDSLKMGVKTCTTVRKIPLPAMTTEQRIEIAIRCVKEVYKDKEWNEWADRWLSGEDRTANAATIAYAYAAYAAYAADAATFAAIYAADTIAAAYAANATIANAYAANAADAYNSEKIVEIIHQVVDKSQKEV